MNTKNDEKVVFGEGKYLSAVALSFGERLWWDRPEELFSGVEEEFLD